MIAGSLQLSAISEEPRRMSRTWGELPTRDEFQSLWDARDDAGELRGGLYRITLSRSDSEAVERYGMGEGSYTAQELYRSLLEVVNDPEPWDLVDVPEDRTTYRCYERHEQAMNLVSSILETLGMEWI